MTREEQNGPGFYYIVRWRQRRRRPAVLQEQDNEDEERTERRQDWYDNEDHHRGDETFNEDVISSERTELIVDGQPVYAEYDIYVSAANDVGPAVASAQSVVGHSGEDGTPHHITMYRNWYTT